MKILIIAYHFYPDITPRSFRAFELTKQFAKEGHDVKVVIPYTNFDYKDICKKYNFNVDFINYEKRSSINTNNTKRIKPNKNKLYSFSKRILKPLKWCIFPSGTNLKFYFSQVYQKLKTENEKFDMIISIATPYDNHIGTAFAIKKNVNLKNAPIKIAEYGDPLYKNPALPNCPLYYWIDKFIATQFNFITTPTEKAVPIFEKFKEKEYIKVIPQGFNFDEIKTADYTPNTIPTFGYAGLFYEDIRNPKPLLDYLIQLDKKNIDFKFIIYTKTSNKTNMTLLVNYAEILGEKLEIKNAIPRKEVIYELSKMDFLINIENLSSTQIPSKLIDYALTKRPIYNFSQNNFSKKIFNEFLNGNYKEDVSKFIDLNQYNIENIATKFLQINNGKNI